ncbi:hypothetical protein GCM10022291_26960 [Postechiella marina]|uniref:Uncharacterized protein n=1 Tax=Postechiella marina TaxID=943941 RepID=A0ABP8CDQ8_9FLAO
MILKGFKEKSNKKYLNKMLSKREVNVDNRKVESLGVIVNVDEFDNFEVFLNLANRLNLRSNGLKIIAFSNNEKEDFKAWETCFTPKDFGWKGNIKHVELQSFLNKKFDALISFYTEEKVELKMMTVLSHAQFKIGILQTDARLNDLIIKTGINEFDVFENEVFKYLTILNKIKNEQ